MSFWHENRTLDDFVRASDRSLNVLVIVLLAAFALGSGAYYYGQMNPRVETSTADSGVTLAPPATQPQ
ncbi:MAG: histone deacetylase [Proteobacteria bacterium]|nr:histone deacetylase [Pseudomonadota bacterium]